MGTAGAGPRQRRRRPRGRRVRRWAAGVVHPAGLTLLPAPGVVVRYAVMSGIVHVDSDADRIFTLSQFFDEWQVALAANRLGGLGGGARDGERGALDDSVTVYVDGSRVAAPPGSVRLTPHLQIAVTYRPGPVPVPARYAFPAGT